MSDVTPAKTSAHSIITAGVTRVHVTIDGTTHVLHSDDAAILALQVKREVPTAVTVEGDRLTIETGYDAMSCGVAIAIDALVKAGRVMDHRKVLELMDIEDAGDMEHALNEIGAMALACMEPAP